MGAFAIYNDCNTDSTIISNLFIDEYMKDAGEVELKVYLYLVRMMSAGRSTSISEMSELFGHSEKEITRALNAWEKRGLLVLNKDSRRRIVSIHLCPVEAPAEADTAREDTAEAERVISIAPALAQRTGSEDSTGASKAAAASVAAAQATQAASAAAPAASTAASDADRAQLLFIVEQYIGKPLSLNEMQIVNYMADELHFSDDLIDYLVQYCVERGKKDFRYIEKVALNWKENGIQTAQDARKAQVQGSRTRRATKAPSSRGKNSFNEFQQNSYDFEALEKALLKQE